jgi:hypothetical protein
MPLTTRLGNRLTMSVANLVSVAVLVFVCGVSAPRAAAAERNACGCIQTDTGMCICDKKARCGCPGLCEPQGCEAQREKAFQREIDAEMKKARDAEKQRVTTQVSAQDEPEPASAPAAAAPPARTMTRVQTKELVRLLDLYFAAHPDARRKTAGTLREQLQ